MPYIALSCLSSLAKKSRIMVDSSRDSGHRCFSPDLGRNVSTVSILNIYMF